jgi:hypothetical protein
MFLGLLLFSPKKAGPRYPDDYTPIETPYPARNCSAASWSPIAAHCIDQVGKAALPLDGCAAQPYKAGGSSLKFRPCPPTQK